MCVPGMHLHGMCAQGTCSMRVCMSFRYAFSGYVCVPCIYSAGISMISVCVPVCVFRVYMASGEHVCPHLCVPCAYACSCDVHAPGMHTYILCGIKVHVLWYIPVPGMYVPVHICAPDTHVYICFITYYACVYPHVELGQSFDSPSP